MKKAEKSCGIFWRLLKIVNVFLAVSATFLSIGLYCSAFDKKISVPDFIVKLMAGVLNENGVDVKFTSVHLGLDFSIVLSDVHLRAHGTPNDFFRANQVNVGVDIFRLFCGKVPVRYISVAGGEATQAYEKKPPVIRNIDLMLNVGLENYGLDFFRFRIHNFDFSATGKIEEGFSIKDIENLMAILSAKFSGGKVPKQVQKPTFAEIIRQYDDALSGLSIAKNYFEMFSSASVDFSFGLLKGGINFINFDLISSGAKLTFSGNECNFDNLNLVLRYANTNTRERVFTTLKVDELKSPSVKMSVRNVNVRSGIHINSKDIALYDIDFSAKQIEYDGTSIDNVLVSKKLLSSTSFKEDWHFFIFDENTRLSGDVSVNGDDIVDCRVDGSIALEPLFARKELSDIPELKDFNFPHGINLSADIKYEIGADYPVVDARIDVSDSIIMRLDIDSLSADVSLKDGVLNCTNIKAQSKEGWGAKGSYIQNFKNNAYDIEVVGNLRPMAIAHFMEPWWSKIMGSFSFADNKQMPFADVRVEGVWGAPENIWCFGFVDGENALYNGSKFDAFSLYIWVNPTRISLYDIAISTGYGARKGRCFIEWLYDGDQGLDSFDKQRLFLKSNLNDIELVSLGGEDAKEIFDVVKFENPPELVLSALMYNSSNNPKNKRDIFNAEIRSVGKVSVEMIHLENAHFFARSDKINTEIYDAQFSFCDGVAMGQVDLVKQGNTMLADGSAQASKMNQGRFFKFLSSLGSAEESSTGNSTEKMLGGDSDGEVSASLSLKGDVKNMSQAEGKGEVLINSEDFLKLNLFGEISKAFDSLGVPVGSFKINKVQTDFELSRGELKLSPVEMSGPALRIIGAVVYVLSNDSVRGEIKAYPFDKVENKIISAVNTLVNPIMDTVRVIVSGTLSEPEFSAKISPADVIRSEKNVIERIDKSL